MEIFCMTDKFWFFEDFDKVQSQNIECIKKEDIVENITDKNEYYKKGFEDGVIAGRKEYACHRLFSRTAKSRPLHGKNRTLSQTSKFIRSVSQPFHP